MTAPTRQDATIWQRLAAPIPQSAVQWRPDGKPIQRDGRTVAREVAYIEANTVRSRLDAVVPGEWDLILEILPAFDEDGARVYVCKARLQVLGVVRESVGSGDTVKAADTDAFKRAAVRFGIGNELYDMPARWAPTNGHAPTARPGVVVAAARAIPGPNGTSTAHATDRDDMPCPVCGGAMADERTTKRSPKAPDYRCRDRGCPGVVWPAKAPASVVVPDAIPF